MKGGVYRMLTLKPQNEFRKGDGQRFTAFLIV